MSSPTPYQVLCVCLGNICRSPTAETVLRQQCDEHKLAVYVDSAGTANYHVGKAPDQRSQRHGLKRGYNLSALRARQIELQDFIQFDLILAMDLENLKNIQALAQQAIAQYGSLRAQIFLFSQHDKQYPQQALPDPYYGDAEGFERVIDQCESSAAAWVEIFKAQGLKA